MRIRSIDIAGYGRFSNTRLEFAPGLQVIMGPNEKGKSTIRSFVADMLFGQKCNDAQRIYEESNALRAPWNGCETYGGALVYELDDGRVFEVVRSFDKNTESIHVFDRIENKDVSETFTRYRNRELDFARRHLGLTKSVFLSTATISHMSLTDLGDSEALDQIRETMLALTDSGGGAGTVEGALALLTNRIASIGRPDIRNRPLPQARQQLAALEKELGEARQQQETLRALAGARKSVLDASAALQQEKRDVEAALRTLEFYDDIDRLQQAEEIQSQIDAGKREAAVLAHVRHFPLDLDGEVQAAHRVAQAAERQLEKSRAQCDALRMRLKPSGEGASRPQAGDFPAALEQQIIEAEATRAQLAARSLETHTLLNAARERMDEVQRQLAELPDFSRLAADPVEWLSQLASSFAVALRARNEECALRDALRKEVEALEDANTPYDGLFAHCTDFSELAREYEVQVRVHEEQRKRQASELHSLQVTFDEAQGETQAFLPLGAGCLALAAVLGGLYFFRDDRVLGIGALVALVAGLLFIGMRSERKGRINRLRHSIGRAEQDLAELAQLETDKNLEVIKELLHESGRDTVRELEAQYDQYKSTLMELRIRRDAFAVQNEKAVEAEERIPLLLARFKDTFAKAGENIETEGDVQDAAGRAIARYQDYREAKRRATSNRSVLERHEAELKRLDLLVEKNRRDLEGLEQEARAFVRDCGFLGSTQDDISVRELIGAFRQTVADSRELRGRNDMLAENLRALERQSESEASELDSHRRHLESLFTQHGISTMDEWNVQAGAAREFQRLERQVKALEDRLAGVLGRHTTISLRERVARVGTAAVRPEQSREALLERSAALGESVERKIEEEHALHVQLTQQSVRTRSISEIEEEMALLAANIRDMELEVEATSYAMALMEDMARDKHARIAPRLAQRASGLLSAITGGNYAELFLARDLGVSVRIPETDQLNTAPEKSLSKGTVDQIYLALRLAFVQCVSENAESIPMLLDDPFANYDDGRLESTMALISELVGESQVLLFTCREDVVAVAEKLNASILRL